MKNLLSHLLGETELSLFLACVCFALLGVVISLLVHATNRNKESMRTPYKFNFIFLIEDNWQRVLLNLILIVVTIRFYKELTGMQINMFLSLMTGIGYDKLGEYLRNKCLIDNPDTK